MKKVLMVAIATFILCVPHSFAESTPPVAKKAKIRYKKSKVVDFEELLIRGQLARPNLSVVTGSVDSQNSGLLRLRKDFLDRIAQDFGEKQQ